MEIDYDKIDEAVLALMWLTLHDERRAWKSFDWSVTDRLYQMGFIEPRRFFRRLIGLDSTRPSA
jgi:hypothetical protein